MLSFISKKRFIIFISAVSLLKIILAGVFSSDYQNNLFMPFVYGFLDGHLNPYDYFAAKTNYFPYPPLMLFIEVIGGFISKLFTDFIFLQNLTFKLSIFFADILCFYFLSKIFCAKRKYITVIYFASPIILYSCYMHGQLDLLPTAFLIGSVYFISKGREKLYAASLLLTAAVLCKFHILAIVPILFLFITKRDGIVKGFIYIFAIPFVVSLVVIIPFLCPGFINNVIFNAEQSVLTKVFIDFNNLRIFVPILVISLIYLKFFTISRVNMELLYGFSMLLFSVFLLLIPPMPGWYVWIVPFLVVFYIDVRTDRKMNFLIYGLLNTSYVLFFVFAHKTNKVDLYFINTSLDFIKIQNNEFCNLIYTFLVAVHVYVVWYIYKISLRSNVLYKMQNKPFVVGISGDSGSGKSTLTKLFNSLFGTKNILLIECDGDHRWGRGDENWKEYTHLNPKANFLYRQANDIELLKAGNSVLRTEYNHDTGKIDQPHKVLPKPYILVTGLHSLYLPQLRGTENLKIFMDIDENLRRFWKIQRDTKHRGYSKERIIEQIEQRMDDYHHFIEPQKRFADLLIQYFDRNLTDCLVENYTPKLSLKLTININLNLEQFITELIDYGIKIKIEFDDTITSQILTFESENLESLTLPVMKIAKKLVPEIETLIKQPLQVKNDMQGIISLVILLLVENELLKK